MGFTSAPSYHPERGKTMKKREVAIMAALAAGGWTVVEPIPMTAKQAGFSYKTFAGKPYEKLKVYMLIANTM
ncbi:MAG: hypothetical protein ACK559_19135 [bacterium]|jgi:hypothetical protein